MQLPRDQLASDSTLSQVWQCSEVQYGFEYRSGVIVYLSPNTFEDPDSVWKQMAEDYDEFSVGSVDGIPASLVDPAKAPGAEGGVDFVRGNTRITVSGNGKISLADLLQVAGSVSPLNAS